MSKNSKLFAVSLIAGITVVLSGSRAADSKKVDMAKVPPASAKKGVTFDGDIKPILDKSCAKCHGGDKPKGKYRVDTAANFIKGGESGDPVVVAGHSDKSAVIHYVSDAVEEMEMPPLDKRDKYPVLTKEQIGLLRAWIDQGAK